MGDERNGGRHARDLRGPGRSPDLSGLDPSGFELFNGEVLFNGKDASGNQQLWETDGTAGGTHELAVAGASPTTGLVPLDLTAIVPTAIVPLNLLWQNTTSGQASIWQLNGGALIGGGPVSPSPGPSWKAIGTADFFGGGSTDILWQNTSSGQASIWKMNGSSLIGGGAGDAPIRGWPGMPLALAISTTTAFPTSCGRTRTPAKPRFGRWTGTP